MLANGLVIRYIVTYTKDSVLLRPVVLVLGLRLIVIVICIICVYTLVPGSHILLVITQNLTRTSIPRYPYLVFP